MTQPTSVWSKRYVLVSALALVAWQAGIVAGVPRRAEVSLALYGFVFHMIFGKGYALVPAYFDRRLTVSWAPPLQFPLVVLGATGLVGAALGFGPVWLPTVGAVLWGLGVLVFVAALGSTVGDALVAGETGTGDHNAAREPVDRLANLFVPVALAYLLVGAYETVALHGPLPTFFDGLPAQATHLLAAGAATVLVFALGFRLLPRFLVAQPPLWAVRIVLPAGAVAPLLLVVGLLDRRILLAGAVLEALAIGLFAATYLSLFRRSTKRRVGFYGVAVAVVSGLLGVSLGLSFAFGGLSAATAELHLRLNLLGFLGLTIVGLAYQFYPPRVGVLPGSTNEAALLSMGGIATGLLAHLVAVVLALPAIVSFGYVVSLAGSVVYGYLLVSAFLRGTSG